MNIRPGGQKPIRPDGDGYFTGRKQVPAKGVEEKTLLVGRKRESIRSWLTRGVKRMAFIVRNPKAAMRQRKKDREILREEAKSGKMVDTRHLKDRKISRDLDHLQSVTKAQQDLLHEQGVAEFDRDDINLKELERVQQVRAGKEGYVPGMSSPRTEEERLELRSLREAYYAEEKALQERNNELSDRFSGLAQDSDELRQMRELDAQIVADKKACNKLTLRLNNIPFGRDKETVRTKGQPLKARADLEQEIQSLKEQVSNQQEQLRQKRQQYAKLGDSKREAPEVMERVNDMMVDFTKNSQRKYDQLWTLLEEFPSLVAQLGGQDSMAKAAMGDQIKKYRREEITKLEEAFIANKDNPEMESRLAPEIYSRRLMAMRMDEMIRKAETKGELKSAVENYTGKTLTSKFDVQGDHDVNWSAWTDDESWEPVGLDEGFVDAEDGSSGESLALDSKKDDDGYHSEGDGENTKPSS
ncbi:hypothetical protein [Endozoicomonas lisbonensis]|uniref:DNA repair exonuclease SbcCD ATPase subunit n=1 Tax=Endozoicomonas lisbonensis TaxID=3120522 RepID=A0ABV2SC90_9GAMM